MNFKVIFIFYCFWMNSCVESTSNIKRDNKLDTDSNLARGSDSQIINSKISVELNSMSHST
ncbi:MAG: hypothetical protein MUF24_14510, partial [Chitinophagaceae bacterium]|nr:hypothetical protein [Chitinophagaceae bacterium]